MNEHIAASTLILLRETPGGPPQTLMVERGKQLSFAGGNMVFPGGRADPDDRGIAERTDLLAGGDGIDIDDLTGRIAAIRETLEEVGLAPGVEGIADQEQIEQMRAALLGGALFSEILTGEGLRIDPVQLTPYARWVPRLGTISKFDTRFYLAHEPAIGEARVDGHESSRLCWMTAAEHLAAGKLIFPTQCNLEKLALASSVNDAIALCDRWPVRVVSPWIEERDGKQMLCIPDDLGYPVTAAVPSEMLRGVLGPFSADITRDPG